MAQSEKAIESSLTRPRHRTGLYVALSVLIMSLFTGLIAYGVQTILGGNEEPAEGVLVDGGVREFDISVQEWSFTPAVIRVNKGEKVKFVITSKDVWHGFAINELDINVTVPGGKTETSEVVIPSDIADGSYTVYCSVFCGLGHPYLKGKMIIGSPQLFLGIGLGRTLPYIATIAMAAIFTTVILIGRRKSKVKPG